MAGIGVDILFRIHGRQLLRGLITWVLLASFNPVYSATLTGVVVDDNTDNPVAGILLRMSDIDGASQFVTRSGATGQFVFTNIPSGIYGLEVSAREPWVPVFATQGDKGRAIQPNSVIDIDVLTDDDLQGYVFDIAVEPNSGLITGVVFNDENNDGIHDADEFGIHSVVINATNEIGDVIQTQSEANGGYKLILGAFFEWTITEEQPVNWQDGIERIQPDVPSISVENDSYRFFLNGGTSIGNLNFAEQGGIALAPNVWKIISLPVLPPASHNTLEAIFGDDIPGDYGTDWMAFRFNAETGQYVTLTEQSVLVAGQGYWIIHATNATVILDWPQGSLALQGATDIACVGENLTCLDIELVVSTPTDSWHLIGHSNLNVSKIENWRVKADTVCQAGCTLAQARAENLLHDELFSFENGSYETLSVTDTMTPWDGFWIPTMPGAFNSNVRLLIPTTR